MSRWAWYPGLSQAHAARPSTELEWVGRTFPTRESRGDGDTGDVLDTDSVNTGVSAGLFSACGGDGSGLMHIQEYSSANLHPSSGWDLLN